MSTNATIIAKCKDGKYRCIYTHWDGYPSHNGAILQEDYTDQDKIEELLALGDISILAPSIECPEGHTFDKAVPGYCVAYGRDRGEEGVDAIVVDTMAKVRENQNQSYNYFWDGESWTVNDKPLKTVLELEDTE